MGQARYKFSSDDFKILDVKVNKNYEQYQMEVSVFFMQSRGFYLAYPEISLVLDSSGDTIATGYPELFAHDGQDTVTYHLHLRRNKVPDFKSCRYYFNGYDSFYTAESDFNGAVLRYSGRPSRMLTPVSFRPARMTIEDVVIYDSLSAHPEILLSVYSNFARNKMVMDPRFSWIMSPNGDTLNMNILSSNVLGFQAGKTRIMYRGYLRSNSMPDPKTSSFYLSGIALKSKNRIFGIAKHRRISDRGINKH